jgi:hypothetical protein
MGAALTLRLPQSRSLTCLREPRHLLMVLRQVMSYDLLHKISLILCSQRAKSSGFNRKNDTPRKSYAVDFFTSRQLIPLEALLHDPRYTQEQFVNRIVPRYCHEKKRLCREYQPA